MHNFSRLRPVPDRPPKLSPLVAELNNLNLKSPSSYPKIEEFTSDHDYEALSPSYNLKPSRPAPRPPSKSPAPPGPPASPRPASPAPRRKGPAPLPKLANYQTLGGYCGMEGVPFLLNSKLRGLPSDALVTCLICNSFVRRKYYTIINITSMFIVFKKKNISLLK